MVSSIWNSPVSFPYNYYVGVTVGSCWLPVFQLHPSPSEILAMLLLENLHEVLHYPLIKIFTS